MLIVEPSWSTKSGSTLQLPLRSLYLKGHWARCYCDLNSRKKWLGLQANGDSGIS